MKTKLILGTLLVLLSSSLIGQIYDPVKWTVTTRNIGQNSGEVVFKASIDEGWHLYGTNIPKDGPKATSIVIEKLVNAKKVGELVGVSKLNKNYDSNFEMELSWYMKEAVFIQKISFENPENVKLTGYIEYMSCNDMSCLPPKQEPFEISVHPVKTKQVKEETSELDDAAIKEYDYWMPTIKELNAFNKPNSGQQTNTLWYVFLGGFLGGLLALLTPCVWPIIPMTVSFFIKRSSNKYKARWDAALFGISIILIYLALGLFITLIFGAAALNSLSTSALFNVLFFILLVIFAISFLGAFEITLPASWSNKIDSKVDSTAGFISILFMAFTLALVSFSCTGPIIGTLLVQVSRTGSFLAPAIGMLGFSLALAIPFSLLAMFPSWLNSLPKSGNWLNSVKIVLAFLELSLALKFLSVADLAYGWGILDREVFLSLWIVIFVLLGMYLIGKLRFKHDSETKHVSVLSLLLAILSFSFSIYLLPGLWGAPTKAVSAFTPPLTTQDFNLDHNEVEPNFMDYEQGMRFAAKKHLPVIIDFSGYGCVNCRKMEATVWTDPNVEDLLKKKFVLISLYVDDKSRLDKPYKVNENGKVIKIKTIGDKWSYLQRSKFGANAQPFYVMLDERGIPLNRAYTFDENPDNFYKWLMRK